MDNGQMKEPPVEQFGDESPGLAPVRGFLHRAQGQFHVSSFTFHEKSGSKPRTDQVDEGSGSRPESGSVGLVLTHGAGGNCNMPLLVALAEAFAAGGGKGFGGGPPFPLPRAG